MSTSSRASHECCLLSVQADNLRHGTQAKIESLGHHYKDLSLQIPFLHDTILSVPQLEGKAEFRALRPLEW